jgi:prepilin-type N-terminal cleavage/methylation domain-containing protein
MVEVQDDGNRFEMMTGSFPQSRLIERNRRSLMHFARRQAQKGFSLIELVIVVVIIAIIGAIAIPRMSRGAAGAADSALVGSLSVLRSALDLYATEHGGAYPTVANVESALLTYTDDFGNTNAAKTTTYNYGPYLRKLPPLPVGAKKGKFNIAASDGANVGWIYNASTGQLTANCAAGEADSRGVDYNTY